MRTDPFYSATYLPNFIAASQCLIRYLEKVDFKNNKTFEKSNILFRGLFGWILTFFLCRTSLKEAAADDKEVMKTISNAISAN
jgi:hypothetical protein